MLGSDGYKHLVNGVHEFALYFIDPDGNITSWNPGAERLHGFTVEDMVGRHHSMLYSEQDRAEGHPDAHLRLAEQTPFAFDARWMLRKNGSRFWAIGSCSAVRDEHGELIGYSRATHDGSERLQMEQTLNRTKDELAHFAFIVSHDLQEPVRTMKSYGELLARRYKAKLDGDAHDFINFMTGAADRMTQLLRDLLSYSQAGRADRLKRETTSSAVALQWAIMNVNPQITEAGAVVTFDPLPAVFADQAQLAHLFQQLLSNALKFRGTEPPRIHISVAPLDDGRYRFSVRDNGPGVAAEFHERIFEVFKRLHGKDVPGTGIGLSICRKIVEAHSGEIWVDSTAGCGANFLFTLPASDQ